tara:strand:- start:98 stop:562 length:465 start_codon:yes stop_codon:yes gene_type:complete
VKKTTGLALVLTVLAAGLLLLAASKDRSDTLKVTRVVDGDTVIGYYRGHEERVRLIGIDAPEIGQCFSLEAAKMLAHITLGQTIRVETEKDDRDKYGRLLLNLYRDDGVLINKVLIQQGVAIQMAVAPNIRYISELYAAEANAIKYRVGQHGSC